MGDVRDSHIHEMVSFKMKQLVTERATSNDLILGVSDFLEKKIFPWLTWKITSRISTFETDSEESCYTSKKWMGPFYDHVPE